MPLFTASSLTFPRLSRTVSLTVMVSHWVLGGSGGRGTRLHVMLGMVSVGRGVVCSNVES